MKVEKLKDFTRGWIIGDFKPSLLETKDFEVGIRTHLKGEVWPAHYHKLGTEYNVLIKGHMKVCDTELYSGDVFVIEPYEVAAPIFYEDSTILCVKVPGNNNDKFLT